MVSSLHLHNPHSGYHVARNPIIHLVHRPLILSLARHCEESQGEQCVCVCVGVCVCVFVCEGMCVCMCVHAVMHVVVHVCLVVGVCTNAHGT